MKGGKSFLSDEGLIGAGLTQPELGRMKLRLGRCQRYFWIIFNSSSTSKIAL